MRVIPEMFPPKTSGEIVLIKLRLRPALGSDTITAVEWRSVPEGLAFADSVITDAAKTIEARVSGGAAREVYQVVGRCTLASGQIAEPYVFLPIEEI